MAVGIATLLSACNFTPVYGVNGSGTKLENRIAITAPTTKEAYLVTRQLETRLGRADPAPMTLSFSVSHSLVELGTTATGTATRLHRNGSLNFSLTNSATDQTIDSGSLTNFVGYSVTGNTATSLAAEHASVERLMNALADQLVDRLLLLDANLLP